MKLTKSESSRINGAKSHGPKTARGRAFSSQNATSHGLTARTLVLTNESRDEFEQMLNSYQDFFQPSNPVELDLVSDMVAARWRMRRIWSYQSALLDLEMDTQAPEFEKKFEEFDEQTRGAVAFSALADHSKGLATAHRMDIYLNRAYLRAVQELRRLRGGKIEPGLQNEPKKPLRIKVGPANPGCSRPSGRLPADAPVTPEHGPDSTEREADEPPTKAPVIPIKPEAEQHDPAPTHARDLAEVDVAPVKSVDHVENLPTEPEEPALTEMEIQYRKTAEVSRRILEGWTYPGGHWFAKRT